MSWHYEVIGCTECDLHELFPCEDRHYKYVNESGESFSLMVSACYCWECEAFTLSEHFSSERFLDSMNAKMQGRRFEEQIECLQNAIQMELENTKSSSNNLYARQRLLSLITNFIDLDRYVDFLKSRQTSERCLTCGSSRITLILRKQFSNESEQSLEDSPSKLTSNIMHPKCGGMLQLELVRSAVHEHKRIYPARLFNTEGDDLDCELNPQELAKQKSDRADADFQRLLEDLNK